MKNAAEEREVHNKSRKRARLSCDSIAPCTTPIPLKDVLSGQTSGNIVRLLERQRFVVVRLPPHQTASLVRAIDAAKQFFAKPRFIKEATRLLVSEPGSSDSRARSLIGYNDLFVKELFRYRSGLKPKEATQVLASESDRAIGVLRPLLDAIASACFGKAYHGELARAQFGSTPTPAEYDPCPLDYFLYRNEPKFCHVPNCTAHVDRGLLHAVVVAEVPGLEVAVCTNEQSLDAEPEWLAVEQSLEPFADVVVFTNCLMESVVQELNQRRAEEAAEQAAQLPQRARPALRACAHRVAKAPEPRLSLSYELRPAQ